MTKWRKIIYPIWNFEKVESFLSKMEEKGYRVEKRRFLYFFKFKKVAHKNVRYFLAYSPLGGSITMHNLEMIIKRNCKANIIVNEGFEAPAIYRMTDMDNNLSELKRERDCTLYEICKSKVLWSGLFILFIGLICWLLKSTLKDFLICVTLFAPIAFCFCYNLIAIFKLKVKIFSS